MKYFDWIDDQAKIQEREELQEKRDRFATEDTRPPAHGGFFITPVDVAKAIRIAIISAVILVCTTAQAQNAPPTPLEQLARAEYLMATAKDPGDLKAATWHMVMAKAAVQKENQEIQRKTLKDLKDNRDDARTRYLRYLKANRRRIDRISRQAAGWTAKFRSMANQALIQANQRHRATSHHHH